MNEPGGRAPFGLREALILIGFGVLLWTLAPVLSPFIVALALFVLLWPARDLPGRNLFLGLVLGLTLFWLLSTAGFILAPFVLALVLAYILDPLVDRLADRKVPRSGAILLLVLPVLGLIVGVGVLAVPALIEQTVQIAERIPELPGRAADLLERINAWLPDLPFISEEALVDRLRAIDPQDIIDFLQARRDTIAQGVWTGVIGVGRGLGTALTVLSYSVLTPVLTFYLLRDWDHLVSRIGELVPHPHRDATYTFFREYDRLLAGYLRGQITVAVIIGALIWIGLAIVSFPYAFLIGAIAAVFGLIPYLGPVLSLVPAVIVALLSGNVGLSLLKVAGVFGVVQTLDGSIIGPRIVGGSVDLHPVWVVLALSVGGFYFGFVGLLVGVPLAVGLKLLIIRGLRRYRNSEVFGGSAPA